MKIVDRIPSYSANTIDLGEKSFFGARKLIGYEVTLIYVKETLDYCSTESTEVWVQDCPKLKSDRDVFKVLMALKVPANYFIKLLQVSYFQGVAMGKEKLQQSLRELLGIDEDSKTCWGLNNL